jgi:hypothetical protein
MQLATELGILSPLLVREAKLRMSLYTEDTVMFIKPDVGQLDSTLRILHEFGSATGLKNQRGQMLDRAHPLPRHRPRRNPSAFRRRVVLVPHQVPRHAALPR